MFKEFESAPLGESPEIEKRRERKRKQRRKWRTENLEKERERNRKYRAENLEKERERDRKYRTENPEKAREKSREYARKRRAENPEAVREYDRKQHAKQREQLASRPRPDACELCRRIGPVVFDHDHVTDNFRGWLCQPCNITLGRLGDNIAGAQAALDYLKRNGSS